MSVKRKVLKNHPIYCTTAMFIFVLVWYKIKCIFGLERVVVEKKIQYSTVF